MVRAAISTAMGLTVDHGVCQHATSTLRFNLFRALALLTKDPDAHVANWLESGAPIGIERDVFPGGHFAVERFGENG